MKTNKQVWTGAGGSPNKFTLPAISIPAGKRKVIKVRCSQEGKVGRVYVKQASGTGVGFDVRLQETKATYGDELAADAAYNASTGLNPDLFDAIEKQTATSGNAVDFRDPVGADGRPWINQDSDSQSGRERILYLVIIPNNAGGVTTWDATVVFLTHPQ